MQYLYSLTVAIFLTIALIPLLRRYAPLMGLVDTPGSDRKIHNVAMPRTGGLGIIIGAALPIAFLLPFEGYLVNLFLGSVIIVIFGLLDDRFELGYKSKLFGQSLAAIVVMSGGVVFSEFPFLGLSEAPVWLSYPFTFVFLVGVVNGVNFSDGMDGLAAGTSIMALLMIFLLALQSGNTDVAVISLTIVGAVLGFLRYNTFPANIFMGDAGSQFLGFITASLAICATQNEMAPYSVLLPILILGIPIMDIIQVVPVRVHKKLPLPGPDKEHFHHQIGKLGFRQIEVVAIIYVLQTILMGGAFALRYESDGAIAAFYAVYVVIVLASLLWANSHSWQFRYKVRKASAGQERRNRYLRRMHWYFYSSGRVLALLLFGFFLVAGWYLGSNKHDIADLLLVVTLALIVGLVMSAFSLSTIFFRTILYVSSLVIAYVAVSADMPATASYCLTAALLVILMSLGLAIRMTRKQEFSLTTQDLLLLIVVLVIPALPFEVLDEYAVGQLALMVAVLMYASEYVLVRATRSVALAASGGFAAIFIILSPRII